METVPDAGELQANVSLANADKSRGDDGGVADDGGLVERWWRGQKRSQQAFGGGESGVRLVVQAARQAVASE